MENLADMIWESKKSHTFYVQNHLSIPMPLVQTSLSLVFQFCFVKAPSQKVSGSPLSSQLYIYLPSVTCPFNPHWWQVYFSKYWKEFSSSLSFRATTEYVCSKVASFFYLMLTYQDDPLLGQPFCFCPSTLAHWKILPVDSYVWTKREASMWYR